MPPKWGDGDNPNKGGGSGGGGGGGGSTSSSVNFALEENLSGTEGDGYFLGNVGGGGKSPSYLIEWDADSAGNYAGLDVEDYFIILGKGDLYYIGSGLDYETLSQYSLDITITSGSKVSTVDVTIDVIDVDEGVAPPEELIIAASALDTAPGVITIIGGEEGAHAGQSVSGAGDLNGDGYGDVIVGAAYAGDFTGEAYVVFSSAWGGDMMNIPVADLVDTSTAFDGFIVRASETASFAGRSVSGDGDINDDGISDVAVGASAANLTGEVYVIFGNNTGDYGVLDGEGRQVVDVADLTAAQGFIVQGLVDAGRLGVSVDFIGDFDGDGIDDLLIGANFANEAYVIFGSTTGFGDLDPDGRAVIDVATLTADEGLILQGGVLPGGTVNFLGIDYPYPETPDQAGYSVSAAGDINGDGMSDLIVGGPYHSTGVDEGLISVIPYQEGIAYVVFGDGAYHGTDLEDATTVDLTSLSGGSDGFAIIGGVNDLAGYSVAAAGDFNGDGFDDIAVGAPLDDSLLGDADSGAVYLIFGMNGGFPDEVDLSTFNDVTGSYSGGVDGVRIDGVEPNDQAGVSVAGIGDFNGDSLDDLLIGAYLSDAGGIDAGSAYVVFGYDPDGGGESPALDLGSLLIEDGFSFEGTEADDWLGYRVSGAGDLNGDGYDDLIVGAPGDDLSLVNDGSAFIVYGRSDADIEDLAIALMA
jgi:hypothetical protein